MSTPDSITKKCAEIIPTDARDTSGKPAHTAKSISKGFTLVEISMVLVVIGLIILTIFPALNAARQAGQISLTQTNLKTLMTATASFVQAHGCLPCPAQPGGTGALFGSLGHTSPGSACGNCDASFIGIVPFTALGIPVSAAKDGWGHWITMHIDPSLANPDDAIIPPTAPCTDQDVLSGAFGCTVVKEAVKGICKRGPSITPIKISVNGSGNEQNAAVLFISHGKYGFGSFNATPENAAGIYDYPQTFPQCTSTGGYARCNSAANTSAHFYDVPNAYGDPDTYDNILVYANRNILISMFGTGACNSDW